MAVNPFDTESALAENAQKLLDALRSVDLHGAGEHEATISGLCRTSVALSTACAELRQHAKAARRALTAYSADEIAEYVKTWTDQERKDFCDGVLGTNNAEPLL